MMGYQTYFSTISASILVVILLLSIPSFYSYLSRKVVPSVSRNGLRSYQCNKGSIHQTRQSFNGQFLLSTEFCKLKQRRQTVSSLYMASDQDTSIVSRMIAIFSSKAAQAQSSVVTSSKSTDNLSIIKESISKFYESWNKRDMETAISLFSDDCIYEDTLYTKIFNGKDELESHLLNVAKSLPESFKFIIDDYAIDPVSLNVGVQWHVESDNKPLPFTRGSSMYKFNKDGLIIKGFDVPEPVLKSGGFSLEILKFAKNIIQDPKRAIPLAAWVFYCWFVFISDIAPGLDALKLDPATWMSAVNLSLNYLLIQPLILPSFAPVNHPILEGIFNIMLLWATLFFGFILDGREVSRKPSTKEVETINTMTPYLFGMQLLTNAFYLPYLVTRAPYSMDSGKDITELSAFEKFGESKLLPYAVISFSFLCIYWIFQGRVDTFGGWPDRLDSYIQLVSNDRLSFSFLVDLVYFALFQGWLIDDDMKRRINLASADVEEQKRSTILKYIGSYIPFYGLASYLIFRPPLLNNKDSERKF